MKMLYKFLVLLICISPLRLWSCDCFLPASFCSSNADLPSVLFSITCLDKIDTISEGSFYRYAKIDSIYHGNIDLGDTILVQYGYTSCDIGIVTDRQLLVKWNSLNVDPKTNLYYFYPGLCTVDYLSIEGDSLKVIFKKLIRPIA